MIPRSNIMLKDCTELVAVYLFETPLLGLGGIPR